MAITPKRGIRISDELWERIEQHAISETISASDVIRLAVINFFDPPTTTPTTVAQPGPQVLPTTPTVPHLSQTIQPNAYRNEGKDFSKYKQATNGKGKKA